MRMISTDPYDDRSEEKLQIAASLFKWSILGGIAIATIISTGLVGVVTLGAFVVFGMMIKEGSR